MNYHKIRRELAKSSSFLWRRGIISVFVCMVMFIFLVQPVFARTIDKIIAVVNDEVITQSDLDRAIGAIETELKSSDGQAKDAEEKLKEAKANIVDRMIEEKLILSEAKKQDFKLDEQEIEKRLKTIKDKFANEEEFEQALIQGGLTLKHLKDRIRNQELMKKAIDYFVRAEIKINPIEIETFYLVHQNDFVQPAAVKLKSIFIQTDDTISKEGAMKKAEEVLEKLKLAWTAEPGRHSALFTDLARQYSEASNAAEGGDIGFVEQGQSAQDIEKIIFELKVGEFSGIVETPAGLRIFMAEAKRP
ncbi:MAG: SurA N-terminal domain-containing protein, partial [Candidatus Omnitrophota bacterium]